MPLLGWVDFSNEHRNRTMKMLDLLREQGALDELGIGSIRDAFAELFFPGTSTLQTRAKYFLLVPWIIQELEQKCVPSRDFLNQLREREKRFIDILLEQDKDGVIGRVAGEKLKRMPSELYWRGINRYGITPIQNLSLAQYVASLDAYYRKQKQMPLLRYKSDDEENPGDDEDILRTGKLVWNVCPPTDGWQERLTIRLDYTEADFLRNTIIQAAPESLYGIILRDHLEEALLCESIGQLPFLRKLPSNLQTQIDLALNFSTLIEGAHILFNIIIQKSRKAGNSLFVEDFEMWQQEMDRFPWQRWDVNLLRPVIKIGDMTAGFVSGWTDCARKKDWNAAETLLRKREWSLKQSRSKLANPEKVANQDSWVGLRQLVYRWHDVRRHMQDINDGLRGENNDA